MSVCASGLQSPARPIGRGSSQRDRREEGWDWIARMRSMPWLTTRTGVRCLRRDRPFLLSLARCVRPVSRTAAHFLAWTPAARKSFLPRSFLLFCRLIPLCPQERSKQLLQMSCVTLSRGDCMQNSSKVCKSESMTDTGSLSPPISPSKSSSIRSGSTFSFPSAMLFTGNWIASQPA